MPIGSGERPEAAPKIACGRAPLGCQSAGHLLNNQNGEIDPSRPGACEGLHFRQPPVRPVVAERLLSQPARFLLVPVHYICIRDELEIAQCVQGRRREPAPS